MLSSTFTFSLFTTTALAAYTISDDYTPSNFASKFKFFTDNDPTNGYVNYVDYNTAQTNGLYSVSNNQVYMGVDHTSIATGRGRNSLRLESTASYQHGLIILDLAHMPASTCGTWPAFWLLSTSAQWPLGGEVDIIEGISDANHNTMTVHTNAGCSISNNGGMSGEIETPNCDINAPGQAQNQGCSITTGNTNSYGTGFNSIGGGVYATEWTSSGFKIWFFPRSAIPADVTSGSPDPSGWGIPMADLAGNCDWDSKVVNQQIIFDLTFCGDWAGNAWSTDSTCSSKASTCNAYVKNNPTAFEQSFWSVNSLKVYQNNGRAPTSSTTTTAQSTTSSIPTSIPSTLTTITLTAGTTTAPITSSFATPSVLPTQTTYTSAHSTPSVLPTQTTFPSAYSTPWPTSWTSAPAWTATQTGSWTSLPTSNNNDGGPPSGGSRGPENRPWGPPS